MRRSPDSDALIGLLAEEDRLRATAAVVLGARSVEEVVAASGLDRRRAVNALERLAAGGLVEDAGGLRVRAELFKEAARGSAERRAAEQEPEDFGGVDAEAAAVLRNFVRDGRLEQIPAARSKRMVVLDWLATRFEPGRAYPERDVNFELGKVHPDYATLRRYLVDEEFLERRDGFYWRAGGTFEVD